MNDKIKKLKKNTIDKKWTSTLRLALDSPCPHLCFFFKYIYILKKILYR